MILSEVKMRKFLLFFSKETNVIMSYESDLVIENKSKMLVIIHSAQFVSY